MSSPMIKWIPRVELVDLNALDIAHLSLNPNAVDYLTEHTGLVFLQIFQNPNPEAVRKTVSLRMVSTHLTQ
jgi:hypothetical protein